MRETKHSLARRITLMGCAILFIAASGCQSASSATVHPTPSVVATITATPSAPMPTATALPATFPAFHDWRAVYLAPDMHFHAVTPDGKTDVIGPAFPGFAVGYGGALFSAGASPDGRYIAFIDNVTLEVFDLHAQTPQDELEHKGWKYLANALLWAPDSQYLAVGPEEFTSLSTHILSVTPITIPETPPVPGTSTPDTGPPVYPEGWIDDHTLLVYKNVVQSQNPLTDLGMVEAMDVSTGATRKITTLLHAERSTPYFAVSPDGQEVFLYNGMAHDQPYTPEAEVIDTTTGAVHQQAAILTLEEQQRATVAAAAWQPGTHNLAVTLNTNFLVNTDTGASIPIMSTDFVAGWAPDGSTLVLSNMQNDENGADIGPSTLTAVTFLPGQVKLTTLTRNSMDFVFLGFIRSA